MSLIRIPHNPNIFLVTTSIISYWKWFRNPYMFHNPNSFWRAPIASCPDKRGLSVYIGHKQFYQPSPQLRGNMFKNMLGRMVMLQCVSTKRHTCFACLFALHGIKWKRRPPLWWQTSKRVGEPRAQCAGRARQPMPHATTVERGPSAEPRALLCGHSLRDPVVHFPWAAPSPVIC